MAAFSTRVEKYFAFQLSPRALYAARGHNAKLRLLKLKS